MTPPAAKRPRRTTGSVTLAEVARLAGVAPITASRALSSPHQVSDAVRKRVQAAVERTGYIPNRLAGSLASARSRLIAATVPSVVASVFNETLESLNRALFEGGYELMLGQTNYSFERQEAWLEAVLGRRPEGIFVTGLVPPGRARERLIAAGIPVVESWDLTDTPIDMLVGFSHADIGRDVARFLCRKLRARHGKAKRRLAIVQASDERAVRRSTAFVEAATREGAVVHIEHVGGERSVRSGRFALARVLGVMPEVEAVFCSSDLLALGVLTEAQARGLQVPHQLSVVGFGDVPALVDTTPALTTVRINGAQIGQLAAQLLTRRASGEAVNPRVINVGFSIVERESA